MRYCSACGHGNEEGARFCFACGQELSVATAAPLIPAIPTDNPAVAVQPQKPRDSRMAIAGLVIGVISLLFAIALLADQSLGYGYPIVGVLVGLPLSVVSINRNRNQNNNTATAAAASNGLALWLVVLGLLVVFLGDSGLEQYSFGADGNYVVGVDIAPGVYGSAGQVDPAQGSCEFARFRGNREMIDSGRVGAQRTVVTIQESDSAFSTRNCGWWIPLR